LKKGNNVTTHILKQLDKALAELQATRQELNQRMIEVQEAIIAQTGTLDQSVYQEELKRLGLIKLWEDNERRIEILRGKKLLLEARLEARSDNYRQQGKNL